MIDDSAGDGFCGFYPVIPPARRETGLRFVPPRRPGRTRLRDPYGREIVTSGAYAEDNPWRFSTKYLDPLDPGDPDAALLYYGYRSYSPRLGRWLSRDPISEHAARRLLAGVDIVHPALEAPPRGVAAYLAFLNDPHSVVDPHGALPFRRPHPVDRRHPPPGKRILKVGRCSIIIFYGHHWRSGPRAGTGFEKVWNIVPKRDSDKGCAFAGVITCGAALVPNEIPIPGYSPWPGILTHEGGPISGWISEEETTLSNEIVKAEKAAKAEAARMCSRCCCKRVTIGGKSVGLNAGEWLGWPAPRKYTHRCP